MFKKVLLGIGVLVSLILLLIGDRYFAYQNSLLPLTGESHSPFVSDYVEILRDENGVPHIGGKTEEDVFFGLGVAHAQDRLWQMEFTRRVAAGRLSEIMGSSTLSFDTFFRSLDFQSSVESSFDILSPRTQQGLIAYAAGVNHVIEDTSTPLPPEFALLFHRPEKWTPLDSLLVIKMMSIGLSTNMFHEIRWAQAATVLTPTQLKQFFPDSAPYFDLPETLGDVYSALPFERLFASLPSMGQGASNNWTVSGAHTKSGKPILANDPHLELGAPSVWYLAHLKLPQGDVIGATLAGLPSIILGRNDHISWGFTNTGADVQDLYVEKINPENKDEYITPEGPVPFETREEVIKVRFGRDVKQTFRKTRHGPVLPEGWNGSKELFGEDHVLSLAWTALTDEDTTADASLGIMEAQDWESFRDATRVMIHPMQNIVYADTNGHIGYIAPSRIPIRKPHNNLMGLFPAPGWKADYDWDGFIPFEDLPQSADPSSGKLITANNKIVAENYPYFITSQWDAEYRADRIKDLLGTSNQTLKDHKDFQADVRSPFAKELLPYLLMVAPKSEEALSAHTRLKIWEGDFSGDQPEALIFTAWLRHLKRLLYADELGLQFIRHWTFKPKFILNALRAQNGTEDWCDNIRTEFVRETCADIIRASLEEALAELTRAYGPDQSAWRWGEAHTATHTHNPFENFPILRDVFSLRVPSEGGFYTLNRGGHAFASNTPYENIHGSGYRAIYDMADPNNSVYLQSTGQSGHPKSPFYASFLQAWADVDYIPMSTLESDYAPTAAGIWIIEPEE